MGKLLKYEWRKQRMSRMVIGIALLAGVLLFGGGMLFGNEWMMGISLVILVVGTPFVLFYIGIESILILNRDLKTKQSYMLWMVPKSVWEILGSKWIAAILQMFFIFAVYSVAGLLCFLGTAQYSGNMQSVLGLVQQMAKNISLDTQAVLAVIWILLQIFVGWTMVIMTGFLAVILSRTVLLNSKAAGLLSVVFFFVILFVIERIFGFTAGYISIYIDGNCFYDLWNMVYYILSCLVLFGISGWIADKKLSV